MIRVVLDTNVIVSALWSPGRKAADIMMAVITGRLLACFDSRILEEYERVLHRDKFGFTEPEIEAYLSPILFSGLSVVPEPEENIIFQDDTDRKFYEVAKYCDALLITGNRKHYPEDSSVITTTEFWDQWISGEKKE